MGRTLCCMKVGLKRGPWTPEEDLRLSNYIQTHGEGGWRTLPKKAGLLRCGKSCRLRWMNYLRPDVKRGRILPEEEDLILRLHRLLGNRWSLIAGRMPGRTDNEIKNYWNTHLSKKLISEGIDPRTHKPLSESHDIYQSSGDSDISLMSPHQNLAQNSPLPEKVAHADLQPSKEGSPGNENENGPAQCPQQIPESFNIPSAAAPSFFQGHVSYINKSVHPSLEKTGVMGTPYVFQENFTSPLVLSDNQNSLAEFMTSTSELTAVGHVHASYLTNNSLPSSYGLRSLYSQNLQSFEIELQKSEMVPPLMAACNKLSNTNSGGSAFSFPNPYTTTSVGASFRDSSSDVFSSLLESFVNEELHLLQTTVNVTTVPQNIQPCQNQTEPDNLSSDLWSLLSPTTQKHPSSWPA